MWEKDEKVLTEKGNDGNEGPKMVEKKKETVQAHSKMIAVIRTEVKTCNIVFSLISTAELVKPWKQWPVLWMLPIVHPHFFPFSKSFLTTSEQAPREHAVFINARFYHR